MNNNDNSFRRLREGRWLAGVAIGVAQRLGIPVWIVRIALVLLVTVGGLGFLLYLAGWLLIPAEGETEAIVPIPSSPGAARRWLGVLLLGIAALVLSSQINFMSQQVTLAAVLIGIGILLYRGDLSFSKPESQPESGPPSVPDPSDRTAAPAESPSSDQDAPGAGSDDQPATALTTSISSSSGETAAPPAEPTPAPPRERSFLGRVTFGVGLLAMGLLGLFDLLLPGFHPALHHYVALLVGAVGLGLVAGAWFGRSTSLAFLGVLLIPVLVLSPVAEWDWFKTGFTSHSYSWWVDQDRVEEELFVLDFTRHSQYVIGDPEGLRSQYSLETGSLWLDLTQISDWNTYREVEIEVGSGQVWIALPPMDVAVDVEVHRGSVILFGEATKGTNLDLSAVNSPSGTMPMLRFEIRVGVGTVIVEEAT